MAAPMEHRCHSAKSRQAWTQKKAHADADVGLALDAADVAGYAPLAYDVDDQFVDHVVACVVAGQVESADGAGCFAVAGGHGIVVVDHFACLGATADAVVAVGYTVDAAAEHAVDVAAEKAAVVAGRVGDVAAGCVAVVAVAAGYAAGFADAAAFDYFVDHVPADAVARAVG